MPARQPFTYLCQQTARGRNAGRVDLHVHTTCSDGSYTPAQVVDLGRLCGLSALAITDHDTLGGVPAAVEAAAGSAVAVIPGVEITAEFQGRELHLLAYFVRLGNEPLESSLTAVRYHRRERFLEMVERLRACGVHLEEEELRGPTVPEAMGRRHLAEALVRAGKVASIRDAFRRYLADGGRVAAPKYRLPVTEAIDLVHGAGGVAAWAHPSYDCDRIRLAELRDRGLDAVEAEYPDFRPSRSSQLRQMARDLGLAVSGGSDCHGPGRRTVGSRTISAAELEILQRRCSEPTKNDVREPTAALR